MTKSLMDFDLKREAARLAYLRDVIEEATGEADAIKAMMRESLGTAGTFEAGDLRVTLTPSTRFDANKAWDLLKAEPRLAPLSVLVTVPSVDRALLQGYSAKGDPDATRILRESMVLGTLRVSVR